MPKILFILPAITVYEAQGRIMSWRHTPASHDSLKTIKALAPRLAELGATMIIASDLDEQSVKALHSKLHIPYELWPTLRRLNTGNLHGITEKKFAEIYSELRTKWRTNPDIPFKGGDSLTSYRKRMAAGRDRLSRMRRAIVVIAGVREIVMLIGQPEGLKLERGHIYEWQFPESTNGESTKTMESDSLRSGVRRPDTSTAGLGSVIA